MSNTHWKQTPEIELHKPDAPSNNKTCWPTGAKRRRATLNNARRWQTRKTCMSQTRAAWPTTVVHNTHRFTTLDAIMCGSQKTLKIETELDFEQSMKTNGAARRTLLDMAHGTEIHKNKKNRELHHSKQNLKNKNWRAFPLSNWP